MPTYSDSMQSNAKESKSADTINFSVGSSSTTSDSNKTKHPAATALKLKAPLFSSQLNIGDPFSHSTPLMLTIEEEKRSAAERCLAILGVKPPTTTSLPTREEIEASRREREQEIIRQSEAIQAEKERLAKIRPLVWAKPTFCPFGGETKADSSSEADDTTDKEQEEPDDELSSPSSRSIVMNSCSNLLRKANGKSRRRECHDNLFPNYTLCGPSHSVTTDWSKEEVDRFVYSADRVSLHGNKRIRRNYDISSISSPKDH